MKRLMEWGHNTGVEPAQERLAARAIVQAGSRVLMIHSRVHGDYKFPGGGVEPGESEAQALARELLQEAGVLLVEIESDYGETVEWGREDDLQRRLCLISRYYRCQVAEERREPSLQADERALGFVPAWVEIGEALAANQSVLAAMGTGAPPWTAREAWVLKRLLEG
jgi:8-oxo-dGTP pyrophosphatase MutT (NUDIX family)